MINNSAYVQEVIWQNNGNRISNPSSRVALLEDPHQISVETDCLPMYICKGISIACFYYARCLHQGIGMPKDEETAKKFYSKV